LAEMEQLRGHPFKLQRKLVHTDVRRNAFSQRVLGAWNGLPDEVVLSETVGTFNYKLDTHFLRNY
uniref:tRNA pseudouridine(13) synthase TruD n=1 Tax=Schistocephalus solidus TaxID=70667 RepID=A0A183TEG2_SCHSO